MKKTMLSVVAVLALLLGASKAQATSDGVPSTGNFTIVYSTSLVEKTSSGSAIIVSSTGFLGQTFRIGQIELKEGRDWRVGLTTVTAATALKNAINAANVPVTATFAGEAVPSITFAADYPGAFYNGVGLYSSSPTALSVSAAHLTGGQDNAVVTINAVNLVQGRDWFAQDVSSNTAINLAAGINHSALLQNQVQASWLGGTSAVVFLRAVLSPVLYTLGTSAGVALTKSGATMTGGSAGNIIPNPCNLGWVNALPNANYPAGCIVYLISDPTHLYISTQPVTGGVTADATNSWLAK